MYDHLSKETLISIIKDLENRIRVLDARQKSHPAISYSLAGGCTQSSNEKYTRCRHCNKNFLCVSCNRCRVCGGYGPSAGGGSGGIFESHCRTCGRSN